MPPDTTAAAFAPAPARALSVAILAMGGEGGGVLADWLVDLAEQNGYVAQTTSVPGVAQRTGATIYYAEMFPDPGPDSPPPVLALMPVPGDVDVVIASELMEAGRAVQRGLVTPDRTTFVLSTNRVFAMTEKIVPGDGRADAAKLLAACRRAAQRMVAADMQALAEAHGSVISAALFGALAGSEALPFTRAQFEDAIRRAGVGVNSSLAAFAAGYAAAQLDLPVAAVPAALPAAAVIEEGVRRLTDYQDAAYAQTFLDRLAPIRALDQAHGDGSFLLLDETARGLALWMSYEDTVRVADLKIRATRFARVRREVRAAPDQLVRIKEFLHPRVQEIADTLPAGLGRRLLASAAARRLVERLASRGLVVETSSVGGFLLLWLVAGLRRWRRGSLRFAVESARIEAWLARIATLAPIDYRLAAEVAQCQRLVKGYGDTHERGWANFTRVMAAVEQLRGRDDAAAAVRRLCDAALADETGGKLAAALAAAGLDVTTQAALGGHTDAAATNQPAGVA
jgi:indolepyruvate ferredoxin oxidoreductase beta subunit